MLDLLLLVHIGNAYLVHGLCQSIRDIQRIRELGLLLKQLFAILDNDSLFCWAKIVFHKSGRLKWHRWTFWVMYFWIGFVLGANIHRAENNFILKLCRPVRNNILFHNIFEAFHAFVGDLFWFEVKSINDCLSTLGIGELSIRRKLIRLHLRLEARFFNVMDWGSHVDYEIWKQVER